MSVQQATQDSLYPDPNRRRALCALVALAFAGTGCASTPSEKGPIVLDVSGVNDLGQLVASIQAAVAERVGRLPPVSEVLTGIAQSFVENGREAIERFDLELPAWIKDRLPMRRVGNRPNQTDVLIAVTVMGLVILVPGLLLFTLAIGSLAVIGRYIWEALGGEPSKSSLAT